MPLSRSAFVRSTALALLTALAALLAIVGTTFWLVAETETYSEIAVRARQQRAATVDFRGFLVDAETGQRGYLLTGDDNYIAPYRRARSRIEPQFERVRGLLESTGSEADLDRLARVVAVKLGELDQTVALMTQGRRGDALAIVDTESGRVAMDEAREILGRLVEQTEARVFAALDRQRGGIAALRLVTLVGAIVIIVVAALGVYAVMTYLRQLGEAQREVELANASLEARVAERTAELERANAEVQRFAYVVTHDLRAPLVNIMGFTSELETNLTSVQGYLRGPDLGDSPALQEARTAALTEAPEALGFIRSSTRKMDGLINAILKLSREGRRQLRPEPVDIRSLVETAAANIQHQLVEADGEIAIEGVVPAIVSDRMALEQIFGNLLDNAVKYREPGRPLRITMRLSAPPGPRVTVEVEDNGRGIADEDRERVFELFRRAGAQDQRGEGIGLAHVRALVRNLGGDITLHSTPGRGTTFKVVIPRQLRTIGA
jgi:signal transduction histidine kinase